MGNESQVAITGMGAVSPIGIGEAEFWQAAHEGVSGVRPISLFNTELLDVKYAGQVEDFDNASYLLNPPPNPKDRTMRLGFVAAAQALRQSGLIDEEQHCTVDYPVAVIIGSGHGPCFEIEHVYVTNFEKGRRAVSPMTVPRCMYNSISSQLSITFGLRGANHVIASACASGACAIGQAYELIRRGVERAVLCGGADSPLCETVFWAWHKMRVLAKHDDPTKASRPFDKDRKGLVLAEGAAMIVLESLESARERGAEVIALVAGYGTSSDAFHITAPDTKGPALAMKKCLEDAGVTPQQVDYINAHGTGTPLNDELEAEAITAVFGARGEGLPISSLKSMLGHSLGASGALEFVCCANAIRHKRVPPTINCDHPSPDIGLDYVPHRGREHPVRVAISNSFAFGGNNAVLLLRSIS